MIYQKIIEQMLKSNIEVFVQSTLPTRYKKHIEYIEKLNNKLKLLVKKQQNSGRKINFIDLNKKFIDKETKLIQARYVLKDGIHLNKEAYSIWYSIIKKNLGIN